MQGLTQCYGGMWSYRSMAQESSSDEWERPPNSWKKISNFGGESQKGNFFEPIHSLPGEQHRIFIRSIFF